MRFAVVLLDGKGLLLEAVGPFESRYEAENFAKNLPPDTYWDAVRFKAPLEWS